jgi:hypothetical protein
LQFSFWWILLMDSQILNNILINYFCFIILKMFNYFYFIILKRPAVWCGYCTSTINRMDFMELVRLNQSKASICSVVNVIQRKLMVESNSCQKCVWAVWSKNTQLAWRCLYSTAVPFYEICITENELALHMRNFCLNNFIIK